MQKFITESEKIRGPYMKMLQWREKHITERNFVLILALVVGLLSGFAALLLKLIIEEIASLLNTNLRSIETARYRLRKKLGLEGGANLTGFLQAVNRDADVDDDANADADKQ